MRRSSLKELQRTRLLHSRSGSTLLVVLALLGLLALLGFTFYTFSAQEQMTAQNYAASGRVTAVPNEPSAQFNWALQQLLLGPDDSVYNSVLWGGRHCIVPNMVGRDGLPFNGEGVNISADPTGLPYVDMDYNGTADNVAYLNPVDAPCANNGLQWGTGKGTLPQPDTDYSYPDINHMMLSFDGFALDPSNVPHRVIIPSFFRPQYLRTSSGGITTTAPIWYNNPTVVTASQSFRPHPNHQYIDQAGNPVANRYVLTQLEADGLGLVRPFSFAPLDSTGTQTNGELGIWNGNNTKYNLDVDTDRDGTQESILMDLGYPPVSRADGKLMIPLFAVQIRDLGGLINLNASTKTLTKAPIPPNLAAQEFGADSFGNPRYLNSSNLGQSTNEINPAYGLSANPTNSVSSGDLAQHRFFLKTLGADRVPMTQRELANIEWFFMANGRPTFDPTQAVSLGAGNATMDAAIGISAGVLGEPNNLRQVLATGTGSLPAPGLANTDDNKDSTFSFPFTWTNPYPASPSFGTPVDYKGAGTVLATTDILGKTLNYLPNAANPTIGPNRWRVYQGFHSAVDASLMVTSDVALQISTFGSSLMTSIADQRVDDPSEVIVDPIAKGIALRPSAGNQTRIAAQSDAILGVLETGFLQQSNGDAATIQPSSRLAELMPINMMVDSNSASIRSQFTTLSFDRREFGKLTSTQSLAQARSWENNFFPAAYNAGLPYRALLWHQMSGGSALKSKQLRLSANQILTDQNGDPLPNATPTSMMFRDLIPHPTSLPSTAVVPITFPTPLNLSTLTPSQQEWLARRDRQAMARDIYVLLYMYGGGQDLNPLTTSNAGGALYSSQQLKDMAQFAANYVDSLDRDNVMTRFEYDIDLSNGWGMDDDPYTKAESERAEVWGVEQQELTFSEVLAIRAPQILKAGIPYDHPATEYDDTANRYFTYIQLQSSSPYSVDLSTSGWQVRLLPKEVAGTPTPLTDARYLTPLTGTVPAGSWYTIMSAGDASNIDPMTSQPRPSYFKVDPNFTTGGSASVNLIAPANIPTGATLDLIKDPTGNFRLTDGNGAVKATRGDLLNDNNADTTNNKPVVVKLMRRANLYRTAPSAGNAAEELDNPWIEVDQMKLSSSGGGMRSFALADTSDKNSTPSIQTLLKPLTSRYRPEPFAAAFEQDSPQAKGNYLGLQLQPDVNGASPPATYKYTQLQLDRPFVSLGEIIEIPVVSPGLYEPQNGAKSADLWYLSGETWYLTKALGYANNSPSAQFTTANRPLTGPAAFLYSNNATLPNRWYRLLEFLEIPSPLHRHPDLSLYSNSILGLPANFGWPRVPGQINVNMVRHSNVLGGLFDDARVLNLPAINSGGSYLVSRDVADAATYGTGTRDWWVEFLRSRDGANGFVDPVTGMYAPGVPGARPFRGFNFTARGQFSQNDTLFRTLPTDSSQTDPRLLFEIGQATEHQNGTLDSAARNRLMSKIMNNVTTRSNSYGVFIGIQYFEAVNTGNAIRIGGRIEDAPTPRAFYVIDRTSVVEQFNNLFTLGVNPISPTSFRIVPNTALPMNPPNGVDWKSLILYQQDLN